MERMHQMTTSLMSFICLKFIAISLVDMHVSLEFANASVDVNKTMVIESYSMVQFGLVSESNLNHQMMSSSYDEANKYSKKSFFKKNDQVAVCAALPRENPKALTLGPWAPLGDSSCRSANYGDNLWPSPAFTTDVISSFNSEPPAPIQCDLIVVASALSQVLEDFHSLGYQNRHFDIKGLLPQQINSTKDKPNPNSDTDKYGREVYEDFRKSIAFSNMGCNFSDMDYYWYMEYYWYQDAAVFAVFDVEYIPYRKVDFYRTGYLANTSQVKGFTLPDLSSEVCMVIPVISSTHENIWAFLRPFSLGLWLATVSALIFVGLAIGFLEQRVTNIEYAGSLYQQFSSEVYMVIPVISSTHENIWAFLRPFSLGLWLATVCASIFVGLAIGFLEWRVTNIEYAGSLYQQLIMVIWFPISTIVLQERRIANKWSKVVLVVWLLMAFTLMQSYLSNLYTILIADKQNPKLPKDCHYVGYWKESLITYSFLSQFQFPLDRLKPYSTIDDYETAFSLGSKSGGVDAIIDELPHIELFNAKYGSRYMTLGPIKETNGPGFEFFSKCSQHHPGYPPQASESLDVYGFTGLFIITGTVVVAAILCSEYFLWRGRNRVLSSSGAMMTTVQTVQMINIAQEPPTSTTGPNGGNNFTVEAVVSENDAGDNDNENNGSGVNDEERVDEIVSVGDGL